jgi:hypothetical protein
MVEQSSEQEQFQISGRHCYIKYLSTRKRGNFLVSDAEYGYQSVSLPHGTEEEQIAFFISGLPDAKLLDGGKYLHDGVLKVWVGYKDACVNIAKCFLSTKGGVDDPLLGLLEKGEIDKWNAPPPYCYAFAQNYKKIKYFLLDYAGITQETFLFQIKAVLAAGFPCIFGLTLYTSVYKSSNEKGHIPFPDYKEDKIVGGHTLVAVGYDDFQFVKCANSQQYSKGAFLVRNSWGTEWGLEGYGWLPYDYVLAGLTAAWWSLLKSEWFNENNFGLSGTGGGGTPGSTGTTPPIGT